MISVFLPTTPSCYTGLAERGYEWRHICDTLQSQAHVSMDSLSTDTNCSLALVQLHRMHLVLSIHIYTGQGGDTDY